MSFKWDRVHVWSGEVEDQVGGIAGKLSFLAQDDTALKRITITLSSETSLATMLGGKTVAKNQ